MFKMFSSFTSWSFRRSPGCLSEQRRRTSKGGGGLKNLPQFRLLQFRLGPTAEARPNPHTHTQPNTGGRGGVGTFILYLGSSAAGRGARNATVYPQLSPVRAHAGLKPRTSSSAVRHDRSSWGRAELRLVPAPFLHFTFVGSSPRGYPPPWLVWDQTITFQRVLNNEKKVAFPFFFWLPEDPPLGMTLPSLTAERTPFPAHRSRLPPPHRPAGGEESLRAAAPLDLHAPRQCNISTISVHLEIHNKSPTINIKSVHMLHRNNCR